MKSAQKLTFIVRSLHSEVMQLQSDAGNYNKIVEQIDLLSAVSWDLRRQLQRSRERPKFTSSERGTLPSKIVNLLLEGEYAPLVSSDPSTRAQYLEEIASLHTRRDILSHHKVGERTVTLIEEWLASRGRRLRRADEDISAVICNFKFKRSDR